MPLSYKDHLRLGKKVSGDDHKLKKVSGYDHKLKKVSGDDHKLKKVSGDDHKLDSVDLLRICRPVPVNISFSTVALESVTPFSKGSNSVLKSVMALYSVSIF